MLLLAFELWLHFFVEGTGRRPRENVISRAKLLQEFDAERAQGIRNRQQHNSVDIRNKQQHKANAAGEQTGENNSNNNEDDYKENNEPVPDEMEKVR